MNIKETEFMPKGKKAITYLLPEIVGKEIVLVSHGMNWNWYCHAVITSDGMAEIKREYRLHKFNPERGADRLPKSRDTYDIVEETVGNRRMAIGLVKGNLYFPLKNPGERFSFPG